MNPTTAGNSPAQQAYIDNWMKASNAAVQQPVAQLQETQAAAGAAGAGAAASMQSAATGAIEEQNLKIQQQQLQQKLNQQNFMKSTQAVLSQAAQKNGGYVPPKLYNQLKGEAAGLQIGDGEFDGAFEQAYTDPTNIHYDSVTGRANQTALADTRRQIQAQLENFNSIPSDQKGVMSKSALGGIPLIGGALEQTLAPQATSYESNRAGLAATLKSIAGAGTGSGVRVTQSELGQWSNLLPSTRNSDEVNKKNLSILDSLIKAKFNTDIGLDPKYLHDSNVSSSTPATQNVAAQITGNPALDFLLGSAVNTAQDVGTGIRNIQEGPDMKNQMQQATTLESQASATQDPALRKILLSEANNLRGGVAGESSDIAHSFSPDVNQNPLTRALSSATQVGGAAELPFLAKDITTGGGKLLQKITGGGGGKAAQATEAQIPGKFTQLFKPQATKNAGSAIRDMAVNTAEKSGSTVSGDSIATGMNQWRDLALKANPGAVNAAKINDIADGAIQQYGGKAVSPKDAVKIYNEVDSGFSRTGIQKETIQASADMALRNMFGNELERAAPGWKLGTSLISKGFKADKGAPASIAKNLPQNAVKAGLNVAGLGLLREFL